MNTRQYNSIMNTFEKNYFTHLRKKKMDSKLDNIVNTLLISAA